MRALGRATYQKTSCKKIVEDTIGNICLVLAYNLRPKTIKISEKMSLLKLEVNLWATYFVLLGLCIQ
jgi:hypothetical protein